MTATVAGWPGARYHADFKNMGMMVGGTPVFQSMRGIWVDCIECGRRDAMRDRDYSLRAMSTDEARRIFTEHGWTIKPTRCPACVDPFHAFHPYPARGRAMTNHQSIGATPGGDRKEKRPRD